MEFLKYGSIKNTYDKKTVANAINLDYNGDWVALEKIHGANYQLATDGTDICRGSRAKTISGEEVFFGDIQLRKYYKDILEFYKVLKNYGILKDDNILRVYGEIYGGHYPGFVSAGPRIQKEVNYCPHVDFAVFDVSISDRYLTHDEICEYIPTNLPTVPVIARGTLLDMLAISPEMSTHVPAELHDIEGEYDTAEGIVIKPASENLHYKNDSRAILKNKSKAFMDKKKKEYTPPTPLSDDENKLMTELTCMITPARVTSVISKVGEVSVEDTGRLIKLLAVDVQEEYNEDRDIPVHKTDEWKNIKKLFMREVANIILQYWEN